MTDDNELFDDFCRRLMKRLSGRYFVKEQDREDLVQNTIAAALEHRLFEQKARDPWPWLTTVLNHETINLDRKRSRVRQALIPDLNELAGRSQHVHNGRECGLDWVQKLKRCKYKLTGQRKELLEAAFESIEQLGEVSVPFICQKLNAKPGAIYTAFSRLREGLLEESGWSTYLTALHDYFPDGGAFLKAIQLPGSAGFSWDTLTQPNWLQIHSIHEEWESRTSSSEQKMHSWMACVVKDIYIGTPFGR